jgi:hypothetical protein
MQLLLHLEVLELQHQFQVHLLVILVEVEDHHFLVLLLQILIQLHLLVGD